MKDEQAFPYEHRYGSGEIARDKGMTLRDYFAAKAREKDIQEHIWKGYRTEDKWTREEARYRYADAMLKAREAK